MTTRSREFRNTHTTMAKLCNVAIKEVVKILSKTKDPLVRLIALRKFKNGYKLPRDTRRISREFIALGRIYAEKERSYGGYRSPYKRDKVQLSLGQSAEIQNLLRNAILWVYRFWSPTAMAKLLLNGGGLKFMDLHIREYALIRNIGLIHRMKYREILRLFFT